jgi:hypothetical protein
LLLAETFVPQPLHKLQCIEMMGTPHHSGCMECASRRSEGCNIYSIMSDGVAVVSPRRVCRRRRRRGATRLFRNQRRPKRATSGLNHNIMKLSPLQPQKPVDCPIFLTSRRGRDALERRAGGKAGCAIPCQARQEESRSRGDRLRRRHFAYLCVCCVLPKDEDSLQAFLLGFVVERRKSDAFVRSDARIAGEFCLTELGLIYGLSHQIIIWILRDSK